MRPSPRLVCCLVPVLGVAIAGVAGCSGTRTPPAKTIGQRIEDAKRNTSPGGPARELSKIARFQYRSGDESGALETLRQAQRTIKPDADAAVFAPRLVDIAVSFGLMDDAPAARKAAVDAEKMADRIEDPVLRIDVLSRLGGLYGDKQEGLGEVRKAQTLLAKAEELAVGDAVSDRFRGPALAAVALGYANADLADKAEALVGRLEGLVESLDQRPKVDALAAAANVRAKRGEADQAKGLLDAAAKTAREIDGAANRTYALVTVGNALNSAGDRPGAATIAAEAEQAAEKIGDPEQQKDAVLQVRNLQAALKAP
ncbi:MAG: hypothetical protein ACKO4Z_12325 [Planctomycetota bacterium]